MENNTQSICPSEMVFSKMVSAFKIVRVTRVELFLSATIDVELYNEENMIIKCITLTMDGEDYANWGTDDKNVIKFVARSLQVDLASIFEYQFTYSQLNSLREEEHMYGLLSTSEPLSSATIANNVPIQNTGSRIKYAFRYTIDENNLVIVRVFFNVNYDESLEDGLTFNPVDTPNLLYSAQPLALTAPTTTTTITNFYNTKTTGVTINQFGGIPLAPQGNQFSGVTSLTIRTNSYNLKENNLSGVLSASYSAIQDAPTLLPGSSLSSCFENCTSFNSDISSWNTSLIINFSRMFKNAVSFNQPITIDTSAALNLSYMFASAASFNQPLTLNASSALNLTNMFADAASLNSPLEIALNTTAPITLSGMFSGAEAFDNGGVPLVLNTSSTVNFSNMFANATSFNQPLTLDTSSAINLEGLFANATSFNQPLTLNTSSAENLSNMFANAAAFNQPLVLDVSAAKDLKSMFENAVAFSQNISNWVVPETAVVSNMFLGAVSLSPSQVPAIIFTCSIRFVYTGSGDTFDETKIPVLNADNSFVITTVVSPSITPATNDVVTIQINYVFADNSITNDGLSFNFNNLVDFYNTHTSGLTISRFGSIPLSRAGSQFTGLTNLSFGVVDSPTILSNTSFENCFKNCSNFNGKLSDWNTRTVTNMSSMFNGAAAFNQSISSWNTSAVTNMSSMFNGATEFNQSISSWNTSAVTNMSGMFNGAVAFNQPIRFDVSEVTNMSFMFANAVSFFQDIRDFNTSSVDFANLNYFRDFTLNCPINNSMFAPFAFQTSPLNLLPSIVYSFNYTGTNENIDFAQYAPIINTDNSCKHTLVSIDKNVSNITITYTVFFVDNGIANDGLSFANVVNFYNTQTTGLTISQFGGMQLSRSGNQFAQLTNIAISANDSPIISTNTSLENCFNNCANFNSPLNNWNTSTATNMSNMFSGAVAFNQALSSWNTSAVTNMSGMFNGAIAFIKDISNWNTNSINFSNLEYYGNFTLNCLIDNTVFSPIAFQTQPLKFIPFSFVYTFTYTGTNPSIDFAQYVPIINLDNSCENLYISRVNNNNYVTITCLINFTDNGITDDGLSFANVGGFYNMQTTGLTITQFGGLPFSRSGHQFEGVLDLTFLTTIAPIISSNTSLESCFKDCANFNSVVNDWSTSSITNMSSMFNGAAAFNQPLSSWTTSTVTNMTSMFNGASTFNQNIFAWVVSNVTDYINFSLGSPIDKTAFSPLNMSEFKYTYKLLLKTNWFNPKTSLPINNANNSFKFAAIKVVPATQSLCTDNQIITVTIPFNYTDNGSNDGMTCDKLYLESVSHNNYFVLSEGINIIQFGEMPLSRTGSYNDVNNCKQFIGNVSISASDSPTILSNTSLAKAFMNNYSTVVNISNWITTNVTSMAGAFSNSGINPVIGAWDVSNVTDMSDMFSGASVFNQSLSSWNTSAVTNMTSMFNGASAFNQNIFAWVISSVTDYNNFSVGSLINGTAYSPFLNIRDFKYTYKLLLKTNWFNPKTSLPINNENNSFKFAGIKVEPATQALCTDNQIITVTIPFNYTDNGSNDGVTCDKLYLESASHNNYFVLSEGINIIQFGEIPLSRKGSYNDVNNCKQFIGNVSISASDSPTILSNTSLAKAFMNNSSTTTNISNWITTNVISMAGTFTNSGLNPAIGTWNTSAVTNMSSMFDGASAFNQPLNSWNTSAVTNMSGMFNGASTFNQSLSSWTTSAVTDMSSMFNSSAAFNQPLSSWTTSAVTNMTSMFNGASAFNQNIFEWVVSNVIDYVNFSLGSPINGTAYSPLNMSEFKYTYKLLLKANWFNPKISLPINNANNSFKFAGIKVEPATQALCTDNQIVTVTIPFNYTDNGSNDGMTWDKLYLESASHNNYFVLSEGINIIQFGGISLSRTGSYNDVNNCKQFVGNVSISASDSPTILSNTSLAKAFLNNYSTTVNISSWTTTNVTIMAGAFSNSGVNPTIGTWNVSNVTNMSDMFSGATLFNKQLSAWNTSAVTNMSRMFNGATVFNQPLNLWNISAVTNMSDMFNGARVFNQSLNLWSTTAVTNMSGMFNGASAFNQSLNSWSTGAVTDMSSMFNSATAFNQPLSSWNTSAVTNMTSMFNGASAFNQNIFAWVVSSVTDYVNFSLGSPINGTAYSPLNMSDFKYTYKLLLKANWFDPKSSLPINNANNSFKFAGIKVEPATQALCTDNQIVTVTMPFNYTDNGSNDGMTCDKLYLESVSYNNYFVLSEGINIIQFGGISLSRKGSYNDVTNCKQFVGNVTISASDSPTILSNTSLAKAFLNNYSTVLNISNWITTNVTSMAGTFSNSGVNHAIGTWNVSNVTNMSDMFSGATLFNKSISSWSTSKVTNMSGMFNSASAFNQPLNSWSTIAVTNMSSMFKSATLFNQPLNLWSTSTVTNMSSMFNGASAFNQNISNWAVSNVTNISGFSNGSPFYKTAFDPFRSIYVGTLKYTFTYTGVSGANNILSWIPMANRNNSFGTISATVTPTNLPTNGTLVTVTVPFRYVDSGSTQDGFGFHDWSSQTNYIQFYAYSTTGLTIIQFDGIPLYRNGNQFWQTLITYPTLANDAPTILSNTSLASCFSFTTGSVFNNSLNNWDVSNAINMGGMFYSYGTLTFNEPLNKWNTSKVTNMAQMFANIKQFNQNISSWNTSAVTTMSQMFYGAQSFNQSLNSWDFSLVTDMSGMFESSPAFNNGGVPLTWNTGNVTTMNRMFFSATVFNGGGGALTWNTGKVTNVASMFAGAANFNQRLDFNTSSVNTMLGMFSGASKFNNGDAAGIYNTPLVFNTSLVTNMSGMFTSAFVFNQSIASFNTSNVTTMNNMFSRAAVFNQVINFNTANVTDFGAMFYIASAFNNGDILGVNNTPLMLNTTSALSISAMFFNATSFNQSIDNFNTSNVTVMSYVFYGASKFNRSVNNFNTSKVTDISYMFYGASSFNQSLSTWKTSNVTTMSNAFYNATNFDMPLNSWVTTKVTDISFMFYGALVFNQPLSSWDTSKVTNMSNAFQFASAFIQNISNWNTSLVTSSTNFGASCPINNTAFYPIAFRVLPLSVIQSFTYTFTYTGTTQNVNFAQYVPIINVDSSYDIANVSFVNNSNNITVTCLPIFTDNGTTNDGIGFANVTNFYNTQTTGLTITKFASMQLSRGGNQFAGLTRLAITATDSPKMLSNTSLENCFKDCVNFNSAVYTWDVRRVTNMSQMFMGAIVYNLSLTGWNTSSVTNMAGMFNGARVFTQPLNSWNTSAVTNMSDMFNGAQSYNNSGIGLINTSAVTNMSRMFNGAIGFNQSLNSWKTSAVTNMAGMFNGARAFNQALSSWNTSAVTNMSDMFNGAIAFNQALSLWNTSAVTNMNSMFNGASLFNQNIRAWIVLQVTNSTNFSTGCPINGTLFSPFT